jgi:Cu2+-containing amine oxidase
MDWRTGQTEVRRSRRLVISMIAADRPLENTDLVLWHTFTAHHVSGRRTGR